MSAGRTEGGDAARITGAADPGTETCACPLCGADAPRVSRYRSGVFRVMRCGACDAWYLSPRLTEEMIGKHYRASEYYGGGAAGYDSYAAQERSLRATFRRLLAQMARRGLTGGSVLDVGCGFGYFLQEAASCFDSRAGTELSPAAAAEARGRADEIFVGGIDAVPDSRRFDCITALHVIEHIYRPDAFLQKVLRHLRNDGVLVLAAPDMGSLWRKAMGRRWPSFKYPEHVVFYDADSLASLMRRAGLRDIERLPYPHAFPVADVCKKLGLPAIGAFRSRNIWFPATTVAFAGRISDRASS